MFLINKRSFLMFILSPPLALFIVMSPKAHLTSHYRMSGSRWVTTPLWLSGSLRSFLYNSVYSCHLFLISLLLRSLLFLSFIVPILAWNVLLISSVFLTNTSTIEWCFCFGPAASFFLEVLIIPLCFSPVAYWTPSDLGAHLLVSKLFACSYCSWGSHGKNTGVICHFLL